MNAPTTIIALLILAAFVAICLRGVCNKKHHRGSCGCDCGSCPGCGACRSPE